MCKRVPAAPPFICPLPPTGLSLQAGKQRHGEARVNLSWRAGWTPNLIDLQPQCTPAPPATFGGGGGRQRVHVGGLPALHHRLAEDLQVHVLRVVGRGRRLPRGAAVLARGEDGGRGGGAHAAAGTRTWTRLATRGPCPCEAFWAGGRAGGRGRGRGWPTGQRGGPGSDCAVDPGASSGHRAEGALCVPGKQMALAKCHPV